MRDGYATAQTDMDTSQGEEAGINNPDMWKDFGWRVTHYMAKIGKEIILTHYGKYPDYSYFDGASTGGQQAFVLILRKVNTVIVVQISLLNFKSPLEKQSKQAIGRTTMQNKVCR